LNSDIPDTQRYKVVPFVSMLKWFVTGNMEVKKSVALPAIPKTLLLRRIRSLQSSSMFVKIKWI